MNKFEVKIENDDLVLYQYATMNSESPFAVRVNDEVRNYLSKKLQNYTLKEKYNKGLVLEFNNPNQSFDRFVIFADPEALNNDYAKPIADYLNKPQKRVSRINRHVGKTVVATALVITTLVGIGIGFKKKKTVDASAMPNITTTDESLDFETTINTEEDISLTTESNIEQSSEESKEDNTCDLTIDYSGVTPDYSKLEYVKENYGSIIEEYANIYGVDPDIMIAIATQERGIHSPYMDSGGATGLMQIQNAVWVGEKLTAYNYKEGKHETITVTNDLISDLYGNIKVGCMVFSYCISQMEGNVLLAIQCYNMGQGNMYRNVLRNYCYNCGKDVAEVVNDPSDIGWIDYRNYVDQGDRHYLERILSYIDKDKINIKSQGLVLRINGMEHEKVR